MSSDEPTEDQIHAAQQGEAIHAGEPHAGGQASRLNWLRAGVLGANDGIVSVAGIVVGVAGATPSRGPIFTAGIAGLVAGAVSMALGEYVSVSSQRDSQQALVVKEKQELRTSPEEELAELTALYQAKGLSPLTAHAVAIELTAHGPLAAHLDAELNLDPHDIVSPAQAAVASALSFAIGAVLPLLAVLLPPSPASGAGHLHRRPARARPRRCARCSYRRQPGGRGGATRDDRRRAGPGLHLHRRPSLWDRAQLSEFAGS